MIRTLRRTWNRLLGSLCPRNSDSDLAEKRDSHIHLLAEEDIRRGVPREEAYRRARLRFGGVESTKERYRAQLILFQTLALSGLMLLNTGERSVEAQDSGEWRKEILEVLQETEASFAQF